MRNLYRELFYVPKYGKVREKVMIARVVMTIAITVMCLAVMGFTAYAYFSCNVTSGSNRILSARFETKVAIADENGLPVDTDSVTPITSDNKNFRIEGLEVGKWYSITVEPTERNTAQTGFIILSADNCELTYHMQQLGVDKRVPGGKTPEVRFKLMVTDSTNVILKSHWGTSSFYPDFEEIGEDDERYITLDEEITMVINGHTKPNVPTEATTAPTIETQPTVPNTEVTVPAATELPTTEASTEPTATELPATEASAEPTATELPTTEASTEPTATELPTTEASTEATSATETTDAAMELQE